MKSFKQAILYFVAIVILALPFIAWYKADAILDWYKLSNYTPPADISTLADQDTMTASARHIFYVNHPDIEPDAKTFISKCPQAEKTIVLGCYISGESGIYIYGVKESRLSGVQQVTAAHEMLHGAYDRLSSKERNNIDSELQNYYDNNLHDQRIIDTINSYRSTEPNDLVNEMHSIFGTEIADLPQPLEQYYSQYFTNRSAVVAFANNYEDEFTTRENQVKADDEQLATMKQQITALEDDLKQQRSQIDSDRDRLDSLKSSGQIQQYNAGVASFNVEVDSYHDGVGILHSRIDAYNSLVAQRNSIAQELASLAKALDTRLTPQTAQ
jgi:hypothetical protein